MAFRRFGRLGAVRERRARPIAALIMAALLIIIAAALRHGVSPIVRTMGVARAQQLANRAIYDAIAEVFDREQVKYSDLVTFEKDEDGHISALVTDITGVNSLKSKVSLAVIDKLSRISTTSIDIPIGNMLGSDLLSGRGPCVEVRLVPVSEVSVQMHNEFSDAGINQTRHQILMEVCAFISVLTPGGRAGTSINVQFNAAETVIVGNVPQSYTVVNGDDSSTPGLINDYGA